jgi:hypothetical protein
MIASGHKPSNVHDRYLNFTDKQITDAFGGVMVAPTRPHEKSAENEAYGA